MTDKKSRNTMSDSVEKKEMLNYMNRIAGQRDGWIKKNAFYYKDLIKFYKYHIPPGKSVLEIGSGTGFLLNALEPEYGVGIDLSDKMIDIARRKYPHLIFVQQDGEHLNIEQTFDYIIISDTISYFEDVQKVFYNLKKVSTADTRIIINYFNFFWLPVLDLAGRFKLKMPVKKSNWLNTEDIINLLHAENFELIKSGRRFLMFKVIPYISGWVNQYLARLPLINNICLTNYIIAKPFARAEHLDTVSVVIPACNEKGNIEDAVRRIPPMGRQVEIIFVEGGSTDGTLAEIRRVCDKYKDKMSLKYTVQDGIGKGDAVRKGFSKATGKILMILDADLTVPPEDLPKFYRAISEGKGEFINGTRLVYPMEKEAMRALNILGNKFFSMMFSWLLEQPIKDTLCGTKVISRKNYELLIKNRHYFGDFDPFGDFDLIFGSAKLDLKFMEIPIRYRARQYGSTNISRFRHGWILLKMVFFALNKIKFI